MWLGIFTVSWDRFAQLQVGSFNVKLPTIAFAIALTLTLVDYARLPLQSGTRQRVVPLAVWTMVVFGVLGFGALDRTAALLQTLTVALGAIVPFFAVYLNIRMFGKVDQALTAFIRGGALAAVFGVYQLVAFYSGLPQVVPYEARSGGLGRISSFTYEAGYFGYFLILVIGALFARAALRGEVVNRTHLFMFTGVLILANSRATLFTLPLLFLLLFAGWPKSATRAKLWPALLAAAYLVLVAVVAAPQMFSNIFNRILTVFDPIEASSNAPRLATYSLTWAIARDHPIFGIGAGNLIRYLPQYGGTLGVNATSNSIVANSAWIQAMLDGGIILLAFEVLSVCVAIRTLFRRRNPVVRMLVAGWISTILVSSAITSYFWDMKLWIVLAMAAAIASLGVGVPEVRSTSDPLTEQAHGT